MAYKLDTEAKEDKRCLKHSKDYSVDPIAANVSNMFRLYSTKLLSKQSFSIFSLHLPVLNFQ